MCKDHEMYHYPVELRDIAYRITAPIAQRQGAERGKQVALLLLKNATCIGVLDLLDQNGVVKGEARDRLRAKVLSVAAAYGVEAAALAEEIVTDTTAEIHDVPF